MNMDNRLAASDTQVGVRPEADTDISIADAFGREPVQCTTLPMARILLVEPSTIGQFLTRDTLLRAGYQCEVAPRGSAAVEALRDDDIDMVLLNCQCDKDDWQAARTIRQHERDLDPSGDCKSILIVALTRGSTREDHDRCLAAGIDACVSLPTDAGQLLGVIDGLLSVRRCDQPRKSSTRTALAQPAPFDVEALLHRCLGDSDFSAQVLRKFASRADSQRAALHRAVASGNLEELRREAHSLKGVAANLSADALHSRATRLELAARTRQTQRLGQLLNETCDELARCVATIPQVLGRLTQGL